MSMLKANNCIFLITGEGGENWSNEARGRINAMVRSYILSQFDVRYQGAVIELDDVNAMLTKLENVAVPTSAMNKFLIKLQLCDITYDPNAETANEFIERFEKLVHEL